METIKSGQGCGKNVLLSSVGCSILSIAIIPFMCVALTLVTAFSGQAFENSYMASTIQHGSSEKIAIINLEGVIMDVEDGLHSATMFDYMMDSLDAANEDENVKAVIIIMNTPGGGVFESARIEEKINELQENGKLVYSIIETMSASGGYWIAASSDKIYIQPESMTGSIGVLFQSIEYAELLNKIGLKEIVITNKEAVNKVPQNLDNQDNPQRKQLEDLLAESFDGFVNVIQNGRGLTREEILPYADGRIISGSKAVEIKFADKIGGYDESYNDLVVELGVDNPTVIEYEWSEIVGFGSFGAKVENILDFGSRYGKAGGQVLALPEYFFVEN